MMFDQSGAVCEGLSVPLPPHYAAMPGLPHVRALFFTAMHTPNVRGLDCSFGDAARQQRNSANRSEVARAFSIAARQLLTSQQKKDDLSVTKVDGGWTVAGRPTSNALVMANDYEHAICVLTNDCAPVLLADKTLPVVAAIHLSWKDVAGHLIERTLDAMEAAGARRKNIAVPIGPSAGVKQTYLVKPDFRSLFSDDLAGEAFMHAVDGDLFFAFQDYVGHRLCRAGIASDNLSKIPVDTIASPECYSFRREQGGQGLMLSGIKLMRLAHE